MVSTDLKAPGTSPCLLGCSIVELVVVHGLFSTYSKKKKKRRLLNVYFAAEAAAALAAARKVLFSAHYTLPLLLLLKRQQYKTNHTSTLHYIHSNTLPVDYHFSEFFMHTL